MQRYDYIVVGSGLFGAVFTHEVIRAGKKVLVLEKEEKTGGAIHTREQDGIIIHEQGAHIFHTSNKKIWQYVNDLIEFEPYINSPIANFKGQLFNLPFNMNTFHQMWGVVTPSEAKIIINKQIEKNESPKNLEEQALSLVGRDIFEKLIKGYTEKQWGCNSKELPADIIKRLPLRFVYDNNYFNDIYQGIPKNGYSELIEKLLKGADVETGIDFLEISRVTGKVIYTGEIDRLFGYKYGKLDYRSLRFEEEKRDEDNYQGVAVMNFTDSEIPYTRIIEHKHFSRRIVNKGTIITREYPALYSDTGKAYYPIRNETNIQIFEKYRKEAEKESKYLVCGGRLGDYQYRDMAPTIDCALKLAEKELKK